MYFPVKYIITVKHIIIIKTTMTVVINMKFGVNKSKNKGTITPKTNEIHKTP